MSDVVELNRYEALAEGLDIDNVIRKATRDAEKSSKLAPIFLKRESFAASAISTSSLCVDFIMGGGIPPSRTIGISGPERSGKSLLITEILNNQLEGNRYGVYFDSEGDTDPMFLRQRGIHFEKYLGKRNKKGELKPGEKDHLYYYQPSNDKELLHYIQSVTNALPENRNPAIAPVIFLLDSVVALLPESIDIDKRAMALHAKMYAEAMQVIYPCLNRSGCSFIYTNQLREKPGVTYGSPTYEPCGTALQFASSIRLQLSGANPKLGDNAHPFIPKGGGIIPGIEPKAGKVWQEPHVGKDGEVGSGLDRYIYSSVTTVKNKVFTPQKTCWIRIQFEESGSMGNGLDPVFDIFTFFAETGYIKKASLTSDEKKAKLKVEIVKNKYEPVIKDNFDPVAEFELPARFNYYEFKKWVYKDKDAKGLVKKIRDRMIVSGLVYQ
jgi:RecA/RadA recombinase